MQSQSKEEKCNEPEMHLKTEKEIATENMATDKHNSEKDIVSRKMHIQVRKDMAKVSERFQNEYETHKVKEKEKCPTESGKGVQERNVEKGFLEKILYSNLKTHL